MYIALVVAIAITAIFYNHLETNLNRQVAGLVGTGFVDFTIGNETVNSEIMDLPNFQ